jgi:hypothetical protein
MITKMIRRYEARKTSQREHQVNAGCRVDEVRTILRYGMAEDRAEYLAASAAWREAGEPDVPFITRWYDSVEAEQDAEAEL